MKQSDNSYMILRHLILITILITTTAAGMAQDSAGSALRFDSLTIDYGTIDEDGGMVTKYIEATNSGNASVTILDVVVSCGCTHAEYPRDAIQPGEKVSIGITFDPRDRPGRFEREALIVTSDSDNHTLIYIKGRVTPRERTVYEIYPFDMGGGLRMESNFQAFAYIEHGCSIEERIAYINNSDRSINLSLVQTQSSGALTIEYPRSIAPQQHGDIVLRYSLDEESSYYGTLSDIFQFSVDGKCNNTLISTYAISVDNFASVEDIFAPSAVISKKIIKFGEILLNNEALEEHITLSNSGEDPLIIRCIETDSPAIKVEILGNRSIEKGATTTLIVRLNTALIEDCDNPFTSRIRVICNDPIVPMQVIKVTAIPL